MLIAFQVWSKGGKHRNNRKDNKIDIGIQTETANDEVSDQVINKKILLHRRPRPCIT